MKNNVKNKVEKLNKSNTRKKILQRTMASVASLIVFVTVYVLVLPAITISKDEVDIPIEVIEQNGESELITIDDATLDEALAKEVAS